MIIILNLSLWLFFLSSVSSLVLFLATLNPGWLLCFIVLGVFLLGNYLILSPPKYSLPSFSGRYEGMLSIDNSQVLLIVSNIRKRREFDKNDWGYAWVNLLQKEFGGISIKDSSEITTIPDMTRVVCISGGAVAEAERLLEELTRFVNTGGRLVIEKPSNKWQGLTGVSIVGEERECLKIDQVDMMEELKGMPLHTRRLRVKTEDVRILMRMDGEPVICERQIGKGRVVSLLFDYALQSVSMKQGLPVSPDYRVKKRWKRGADGIKTPDMVMDRRLLDNLYPYADMMDRFLVRTIEGDQIFPGWWYYPGTYQAALIISHDEDYFGDKSHSLIGYETENNLASTFFLMPDTIISRELMDKMSDVGIHWNRFKFAVDQQGLHLNKLIDIKQQIASLKQMCPEGMPVLSSRIHHLSWEEDYTQCFKTLQAAGIRIDSSYGPLRRNKGYLYGTGFPFYPLDEYGQIIGILELPFQVQERFGGVDNNCLEGLVETAMKWNTTLVFLYHPHYFEGKSRGNYLKTVSLAKEHNLWLTNFKDYLTHWESRIKSRIDVYRMEDGMLELWVEVSGDRLTLCISGQLTKIMIDGQLKPHTVIGNNTLVEVENGRHFIEIKI